MGKLKTTIQFDHSPDAIGDGAEGRPGTYRARVILQGGPQGESEMPSIDIPITKDHFTVESEEGQPVVILLAYLSADGRYSPGTPIQFVTAKAVPPLRPTNPRVVQVVPKLEVLSGGNNDGPPPHMLSVSGFETIKEGALGVITGVKAGMINAFFEDDALVDPKLTGNVFQFKPDTPNISVIRPDQTAISAEDYVVEIADKPVGEMRLAQ